MTVAEFHKRFWRKVSVLGKDDCWVWRGSRFSQGYGSVPIGKKRKKAHRIAYRLTWGKIPQGLNVLHSCDNPPCVNPHHLFLGTQRDNMQDMKNKGRGNSGYRGVTHCVHGHPFSSKNTYLRHGRRRCKTCRKQVSKQYRKAARSQ